MALKRLLRQPSLLNLIIDDAEQNKSEVIKKYGLTNGFDEIDLFNLTGNQTLKLSLFSFGGGGSMPTDLLLLYSLAKSIKDCEYFEIGTWRGESAYNVSFAAHKVFTLNLAEQELSKLNQPQSYIDQIGLFSKKRANVIQLWGNSFTFDFGEYKSKIDLVFVDGDHRYPAVVNDTKKAFTLLKSRSSIIVWHDYAVTPDELRYEVMLGILDGAPDWARRHIYKVSNCLCAIYYPYEVHAKAFMYPGNISKTMSVEISPNEH